ncbi:MAG: LamB/YcsF family protein [Pseudomonadota bacterium]
MPAIDLNADMGEFAEPCASAREAALMPLLSSCSVACGGHTGTRETMRTTLSRAAAAGVRCGVHPSYPDRKNFGRVAMAIPEAELRDQLWRQIDGCLEIAEAMSVRLYHLKPHGALYHVSAASQSLSELIATLTKSYGLSLYGPPGSALETQALIADVPFVGEGFVDRTYQPNGALVPRSQAGALIGSVNKRATQALTLARGQRLRLQPLPAEKPKLLCLKVQTLCIHGDDPKALETARAIHAAFDRHEIRVEAPARRFSEKALS